jgi:hypothetical protein
LAALTGGADEPDVALRYAYDPGIRYCGPGASTSLPYAGECLNQACYDHDLCYDTIRDVPRVCNWSRQTAYCDGHFFRRYRECRSAGDCGRNCRRIAALARGFARMCSLPARLVSRVISEACSVRDARCVTCEANTCAEDGANCGTLVDGCGGSQECGTCPSSQSCGGDGIPNVCGGGGPGLPGDPCTGNTDCEPGSICWNETCVREGLLRVSLAWTSDSDFDIHVLTPAGSEIYYGNDSADGGSLDVDDCVGTCADPGGTHVENVVFENVVPSGSYEVWVVNYDGRAGGSYSIDVSGRASASFGGSLPATRGAESSRHSFSAE